MSDPAGEQTPMSAGELQSRAVNGMAWTLIHVVVSLPIAFGVNLLVARELGPVGYGRLAFLTTVITLLGSVAALGLTSAMIQFGTSAHTQGRPHAVEAILRRAQGFRLLVVAPIVSIVVVLLVDVPTPLLALAIVFGIWFPNALDGAHIALQIENRTATEARYSLLVSLVTQAAVVLSVLWLATADAVWAARTVVAGGAVVLTLIPVSRRYRKAVLRPRAPVGFPHGFWRFAIPTGLSALLGAVALDRFEVVFLELWSTPREIGLYALAFGLAAHLMAPAHVLTGPLLPALSGLHAVAHGRLAEAFHRAVRTSSVISALLTAIVLPPLVLLVPTLYGSDFDPAAPMLLVMGAAAAAAVLSGPLSAFVLARRAGRAILLVNLAALVVSVVACTALIPWFGAWGAVVANVTVVTSRTAILFVLEARALDQAVLPSARAALPVLLGAVAAVLGAGVAGRLDQPLLLALVVSVTVAAPVLAMLLRMTRTGLAPRDRDAIAGVVPARAQRLVHTVLRPWVYG